MSGLSSVCIGNGIVYEVWSAFLRSSHILEQIYGKREINQLRSPNSRNEFAEIPSTTYLCLEPQSWSRREVREPA